MGSTFRSNTEDTYNLKCISIFQSTFRPACFCQYVYCMNSEVTIDMDIVAPLLHYRTSQVNSMHIRLPNDFHEGIFVTSMCYTDGIVWSYKEWFSSESQKLFTRQLCPCEWPEWVGRHPSKAVSQTAKAGPAATWQRGNFLQTYDFKIKGQGH